MASSGEASQRPQATDMATASIDASDAVNAIRKGSAAAVNAVTELFKGLLYIVLLSSPELKSAEAQDQ